MTVVSTVLAGLSNGEMSRAQYSRSLAAQQQSKVGDQWSFYQAKRTRSTILRSQLALIEATTDSGPLHLAALRAALGTMVNDDEWRLAEAALTRGEPAAFKPAPYSNSAAITAAIALVAASRPEHELSGALKAVKIPEVEEALGVAQANAQGFDALLAPTTRALDRVERGLAAKIDSGDVPVRALRRDFAVGRFHYDAVRYDAEARNNRAVAELYELQIRLSNRAAERNRLRSDCFFAAMAVAQLAVVLATLSIAEHRRVTVWTIAAVIGVTATGSGAYFYLFL